MVHDASCFTVTGTTLERGGQPPLLAVALVSADGRLAQASVVDPQWSDPLAAMREMRERGA